MKNIIVRSGQTPHANKLTSVNLLLSDNLVSGDELYGCMFIHVYI